MGCRAQGNEGMVQLQRGASPGIVTGRLPQGRKSAVPVYRLERDVEGKAAA